LDAIAFIRKWPAKLEVVGMTRQEANHAQGILREIGGDTLDAAPEETVMGQSSATREVLNRRWVPPQGAPRDQIETLLTEEFSDAIFNRVPEIPLGSLGGQSLRQTAAVAAGGDRAAQIKSLAAVLVIQQSFPQREGTFDYNELRTALGLPTLGPIDPRGLDLQRLPLVRLARIEVEPLNDEDLALVFHRSMIYHVVEAIANFARAVIARPSFASRPERIEAYRALVETAPTFAEGLKIIDEARGVALAAGQSCAVWDLMDLSVRFGQGNVQEAMRLMQHIETRHIKEPGVAQSLTRMLINAGLLNPDGTPVNMPAARRGAAEVMPSAPEPSSKLWTPGSEAPGAGGGGKLWTPGA
jgi:hypothetical protein